MDAPSWLIAAIPVGTLILDRSFRFCGNAIAERLRRASKDGAGEVSSKNVEADIDRLFERSRELEGEIRDHQLKCERLTGEVLTEVRFIRESMVEMKRDLENARAQVRNWVLGIANQTRELGGSS